MTSGPFLWITMMTVSVFLSKAIICFAGSCYPALLGHNTHPGEYQLIQRYVESPGYGGDVLQYDETDEIVFSIHRVWTMNPKENRRKLLYSDSAEDRRYVSNGCVNVSNEVYAKLVDCCTNSTLIIEE